MNISRVKTFPLLLAALAAFATARASTITIHVAPGGTGAGTSWSDALGDVQAAVDAAAPGDTIQLAGGTYAVSSPVAIGKTVFIRGGYDPATGLPGAKPTVVTRAGDATTRLVSVSGVSGGELRDVTLSGGVLYPVADHAYGAGIQISGSTGYALVNCTVSGNKAQSAANKNACGGGVAVVNASSASLTDCSIFDNEVENVGKGGNYACGAGLYVAAGCSAAVTNGVIARNNVVFGQNSQRGADVLGGPQPQSNEIALRGGCGRPRTSAPTGGVEGLWGKDIGSFIRKAQMHFCSDAQMPRSVKTASAVLTDRLSPRTNGKSKSR